MKNVLLENNSAWAKMSNGLVSDIKNPSKARITRICLENARKHYLKETALTGTTASNIAIVNKVMMPLIKRVMPTVMAHDLVGVQPLTGPSGLISTMKVKYNTTSPKDGSGIINGQEALSPFLIGAWYSGNENISAPDAAETANLEGAAGNKMSMTIEKEVVEAKTRRLSADFSIEAFQDAQSQYGVNIEQELTNALANEITVEIDQDILGKLSAIAGLPVDVFDQNKLSGVATSVVDEHAALAVMINRYSNAIAKKIKKSAANWAVVSNTILSVLQSAGASQFVRTTEGTFEAPTNNKYVGTLNGQMKVYVNTYANDDADLLIGYKGSTEVDACAYFCPYIPVQSTGVIINPETFMNTMGLMTRYGWKALTNPSTSFGNAGDYLAKIAVKNIKFS